MDNNSITVVFDPQEFVSDVTDLVSLPEVYLRIRKLMDDDRARLDDFADVVRTDPSLTARVLRIVNSSYYGFSGQIETITRALNFIGIGQLHDLVLSVSVVNSFSGIPNGIIDMPVFWRRSVFCGALARLLAEECRVLESERLFVLGLLHKIGHLILFAKLPDQCREALTRSEQENRPLFEIEREVIGFHYAEVGRELMRFWNLPDNFQEITGCHIEPETAENYPLESSIVHIADAFSDAQDSGNESAKEPKDIDAFAWEITGFTPENIAPFLNDAHQQSAALTTLIVGTYAS